MKRTIILLPLLLLLSLTGAVRAETVNISPFVLQQLNAAQQAMAQEQFAKATEVLDKLAQQDLSPPGKAYMHQFRGNLALQQKREAEALKQFKAAWELKALTEQDQRRLLHTVAQLQLTLDQWKKGTASLEHWMQLVRAAGMADSEIRADDYLLLAQGYSQQEQWQKVVDPIKTAIRIKGRAPEDWYRLQLAAHFQLKQWQGATAVLELLTERYPQKSQYWEQLASVYQIRERHADALATLRAAWIGGHLQKERQYIWLVQLMMQQGVPQRAAEVLQQSLRAGTVRDTLKHQRLLAQAQLDAKLYEQGRKTLQRIAERKPDYDTWRQLAYLELQLKRWNDMKRSIDKAVALKPDAAELLLLRGIADINRAEYELARSSFERASAYNGTRDQAKSWLNYLEQVQSRS
jgi:tetratricopeptide (TPR) repeat protein